MRAATLGRSGLRAGALTIVLGLAGCVEGQFFHPDSLPYTTPNALSVDADDVRIAGPEGARLHGWWLHARGPARGSVLHVHGNAANIGNHLPLVAWLPAAGYNVLLFDYRGFGKSQGKPTLDGVVADTRAALNWMRQRPDVDAQRIAVIGQSLGGATALRAVATDPAGVRLVVVEAAFASYRGIARDAAGWLAPLAAPLFTTLPGPASDPIAAVRTLRVPLIVLHGSDDRVIGIHHGEALFAAAHQPKVWLRVEGGEHLESLMRDDVRALLLDQLAQSMP